MASEGLAKGGRYNITVRRERTKFEQSYEGVVYVERAGGQEVFLLDGSVVLRVDEERIVGEPVLLAS